METTAVKKKTAAKKAPVKEIKPVGKKSVAPAKAEKKAYLTKRVLVSLAKKAGRAAAAETMKIQGYNVIADDGWVVKAYADGKRERIEKIPTVARPSQIILK